MRVDDIDSAKHLISEMINREHDEHSQLLSDIRKRIDSSLLTDELTLVHNTKSKLLEDILSKLKTIK